MAALEQQPVPVTPVAEAPPTLREEQKLFTRRRLVGAAVDVFNQVGYAPATIEDIAGAAGASRATFYLHYKSKADIVREMLVYLGEDSTRIYDDLDALTDPTRDELRDWLAQTLNFWERHYNELNVLYQAAAVEPVLGDEYAEAVKRTVGRIVDYLERHGVKRETALLRATLLLAQLDRFCFFWRIPGLDFDPAAVLAELTETWWTAFH